MNSRAFLLPVLLSAISVGAQTAPGPIGPNGHEQVPNTQKTYVALRADLPGTESVTVKDFTLEREGGTFHFDQGTFYLYAPVEGRVTGAVFSGQGQFKLAIRDAREQRSLAPLTNGGPMRQEFSTLVLRFTDDTADEIRNASAGAAGAPDEQVMAAAEDLAKGFRKSLHQNLELRLLADVLGDSPVGFFMASFRMGGAVGGRNLLFIADPEGTFHAAPDQVELTTWSDAEVATWAAYRMEDEDPSDHGVRMQVTDEKLDVAFERSGMMKGSAETTLRIRRDGVRVVRLNLYSTLRVAGVYSESGAPLDFVQEAQGDDPDFAVILPAAAKAGDTVRILTVYSGKDALRSDGNQTYYLMRGAEDSWYPSGGSQFGNIAKFHMTFHLPNDLQIVATGKQVSLAPEEGGTVKAVWETEAPVPAVGFNLGNFKSIGMKTPTGFAMDAYANVGLPDRYMRLQESGTLGNLLTVSALKGELSQTDVAIRIYTEYYGKLPYDYVSVIQQSDCSYGENWPMLVSVPICGFWLETIQHQMGLLGYDSSYWREVTPHEVSHQWWGNLIGFSGYRDQWMSEGFANFSVGVFLRNTSTKVDDDTAFWKEQQANLLQKNEQGIRPIDAGALTQGERAGGSKDADSLYQTLIYSKGAFVLHMLERMYWTPADGEVPFKNSMHQFVKDYAGKAVTTEDWKDSMEKTMPKSLDLRGDGKLDWFFDEYVYGTELPHYTVSADFTVDDAHVTTAHLKLTQANVSKNFVMMVPLYLELKNGETQRIANVVMHGSATIDQTIKLGKLPSPAKVMLLNYNADVLCDD